MRSVNLQLTRITDRFSITPLPPQVEARCTGDETCRNRASHRLLSWSPSAASSVTLLCDKHAIEWAADHGLQITTARQSDPAA
jgi:hypothetical protein